DDDDVHLFFERLYRDLFKRLHIQADSVSAAGEIIRKTLRSSSVSKAVSSSAISSTKMANFWGSLSGRMGTYHASCSCQISPTTLTLIPSITTFASRALTFSRTSFAVSISALLHKFMNIIRRLDTNDRVRPSYCLARFIVCNDPVLQEDIEIF